MLLTLPGTKDSVEEHGIVVTASLSAVGQVTECIQKGYLLPETLERLCEHTLAINLKMLDTIKHVLVTKVKQHIQEIEANAECMSASDDESDNP